MTTGYHRTIRARYQDIYIPAGIARIYLPTITVTSSLTQINAVRTQVIAIQRRIICTDYVSKLYVEDHVLGLYSSSRVTLLIQAFCTSPM